jgi:hypothetical protein
MRRILSLRKRRNRTVVKPPSEPMLAKLADKLPVGDYHGGCMDSRSVL